MKPLPENQSEDNWGDAQELGATEIMEGDTVRIDGEEHTGLFIVDRLWQDDDGMRAALKTEGGLDEDAELEKSLDDLIKV